MYCSVHLLPTNKGRTGMKLYECKPGMLISIPGMKRTYPALEIANIKPGRFKSFLIVSFKGGPVYHVPRSTEVDFKMRLEIEIPEPSNIIAFEISNDQTNPDQPATRNNIPKHLSPGNE